MIVINRLVVLIPVSSVATEEGLTKLIDGIAYVIGERPVNNLLFLLAVNKRDVDGTSTRLGIANRVAASLVNKVKVLEIEHTGGKLTDVGAGRYVRGWYEATKLAETAEGDVFVIECDSEDHPVTSFEKVLDELLSGKRAAMSTRFFKKGAAHKGPLARQITSLGATLLGNIFGSPGIFVPDLASGLEGYDARLLAEVFKARPWDQWVTMGENGTTVLINTELRLYVLWYLQSRGNKLKTVVGFPAIEFSERGSLQGFPPEVAQKAISGLFKIFTAKKAFLVELRRVPR